MKKLLKFILISLIIINISLLIYNFLYYKNSSFIVFDSNNIWKIDNKTKAVSKSKIKRLNYSNAKLYTGDVVQGYFESNGNFNFYDKSISSKYNLSKSLIVIGDSTIKNYTNKFSEKITKKDENLISEFLNNYSLKYKKNSYITKAEINNNVFYSVISSMGVDSSDGYAVIFVSDGSESKLIYKMTSQERKLKSSSLSRIADIDNDDIPEVILLSDIPGSAGNECYSLYKYDLKSNDYKPVINCEEE